jgi:glycine cleavage system H lipoate-binding protein
MVNARAVQETKTERPCIWVLAGVLNYRLCDREYDCENCELFHALQRDTGTAGSRPATAIPSDADAGSASLDRHIRAHLSSLMDGCRLHLDRPYRPPHFWLRERKDGEVDIGLDPALVRILQPIRRVVTPGEGISLDRGQSCGWIARESMAVPLRMPVAGEVTATNSDALESGAWLFRIRPREALEDVPEVVRGEAVLAWYMERIRVLKEYLAGAVCPEARLGLGTLMADGGAPQPCLEDVLGREAFRSLVDAITDA